MSENKWSMGVKYTDTIKELVEKVEVLQGSTVVPNDKGLLVNGKPVEIIGRGGGGEVYKILNKENKYQAVKIASSGENDSGEHLYFEKFPAGAVKSDALMKMYYASEDGKITVTEYCEKGDLGQLDRAVARELCGDPEKLDKLLGGLGELHDKKCINRDIKPPNIFVREDGSLVIGDPGIMVKCSDDYIISKAIYIGTPDYVGPENASEAECDQRKSDIYGLGMTLFEIHAVSKGKSILKSLFPDSSNGSRIRVSLRAVMDPEDFQSRMRNKLDEADPPLGENMKTFIMRACDPNVKTRASLDELKGIVNKMKKEKKKEMEKKKEKTEETKDLGGGKKEVEDKKVKVETEETKGQKGEKKEVKVKGAKDPEMAKEKVEKKDVKVKGAKDPERVKEEVGKKKVTVAEAGKARLKNGLGESPAIPQGSGSPNNPRVILPPLIKKKKDNQEKSPVTPPDNNRGSAPKNIAVLNILKANGVHSSENTPKDIKITETSAPSVSSAVTSSSPGGGKGPRV
ncbi:MAG: protein kinase family protein [Rickettsiales bacterium]|jgi:serine/threonine protein kinase|nr:protein kinase family protein [Rickettsiales bacterium]